MSALPHRLSFPMEMNRKQYDTVEHDVELPDAGGRIGGVSTEVWQKLRLLVRKR